MAIMKIKDINHLLKSQSTPAPLLLQEAITTDYPVILDDEGQPVSVNFTEDYEAAFNKFDRYFVKHYGERVVDFVSTTTEDIIEEWYDEVLAAVTVYIYNWARLYYALSLQYNPLYNVDGVETTVYGSKTDTFNEGNREHTEGAKTYTNGSQTNTSTDYSVSYDAQQEKETGKTSDTIGQKIDSEAQYTNTDTHALDTSVYGQHTDTLTRKGNIGVTKSTELLRDTFSLYGNFAFWDTVFHTLIESLGAYWED